MCLILFAHDIHPDFRLVLVSNRDEFHDRPALPLGIWEDPQGLIGGRDLSAGGAWLAATPDGRWSTVTNFREIPPDPPPRRSRGELVIDYLGNPVTPSDYLEDLTPGTGEFAGFNLLVGNTEGVWWMSNRAADPTPAEPLAPGVHGLSNELLNTPWPKVVRGKRGLADHLGQGRLDTDDLFALVADDTPAPTGHAPLEGYSADWEAALSAPFVRTPRYGTRASTVLLIDRDGGGRMIERRFDAGGQLEGQREITW